VVGTAACGRHSCLRLTEPHREANVLCQARADRVADLLELLLVLAAQVVRVGEALHARVLARAERARLPWVLVLVAMNLPPPTRPPHSAARGDAPRACLPAGACSAGAVCMMTDGHTPHLHAADAGRVDLVPPRAPQRVLEAAVLHLRVDGVPAP
jgi:hypothetical protein